MRFKGLKWIWLWFWVGGLACMVAGCENRAADTTAVSPRSTAAVDHDRITQVSIINALLLGQYDGVMPLEKVLEFGDFGLGTVDQLDGELIVLDGRAYQAKSDGTVVKLAGEVTTPFAIVTPFETDGQLTCPQVGSLEELDTRLDGELTSENAFFAIRIDVELASITLRSVPRQEPPYVPLAEASKKQTVWTRENLRGTLLGIRCPKWVSGISVPGYHWHFLSADQRIGGHVIDCKIQSGKIAYDRCGSWLIELDPRQTAGGQDWNKDLSKELEQVERPRGGS